MLVLFEGGKKVPTFTGAHYDGLSQMYLNVVWQKDASVMTVRRIPVDTTALSN
jgi:hypothetical protein